MDKNKRPRTPSDPRLKTNSRCRQHLLQIQENQQSAIAKFANALHIVGIDTRAVRLDHKIGHTFRLNDDDP